MIIRQVGNKKIGTCNNGRYIIEFCKQGNRQVDRRGAMGLPTPVFVNMKFNEDLKVQDKPLY